VPRIWFLLTLIVAFVGTPFRLAEAASDLARSMVEAAEVGAIEVLDGGVGDDSGESIRSDLVHFAVEGTLSDDLTGCSPFVPAPRRDCLRLCDPPLARAPSGSTRRHVLLERFLC
jgi:hypothetical protein